jgi:hypothetical protein
MGKPANAFPNTAPPQMQIHQFGNGTSDELHVSPSRNSLTKFRHELAAIYQQRFRRP